MSAAVGPQGRDPFPVSSAVSTASIDQVSQLLKQGHSPDRSLPGIPPPLYRAVHCNRPDVALALIRAGCDVKPMSEEMQLQYPPIICLAAHLDQTEVVLELCKNTQCDISATNDQQQTIVHLAVLRRNYDLVKRLPLQCLGRRVGASAAIKVQLCCFLMNFSTTPDGQFVTPLMLAASRGDLTMLNLLLTTQTFFKTHLTPLMSTTPGVCKSKPQVESACIAISCLELNGKCAFLPNSCSVTDTASRFRGSSGRVGRGGTALSMDDELNRCVAHYSSTVKPDCQHDSNSIGSNNASSCECCHPTDQATARKQLINQRMLGSKDTLLHFATMGVAVGQRLDVMEFLIKEGAEVNLQNSAGNTALHLLCMQEGFTLRSLGAAHLLLKSGAKCNLKGSIQEPMKAYNNTRKHSLLHPQEDERGLTVAMIAAMRNHVTYLKLLSDFGARFDEVNEANMTTLMLALKHGMEKAVVHLLNRHPEGASFHAWVDNMGYTVLHYVCNCSNAGELTEWLLSEGYEVVSGTMPSSRRCACGIGRTVRGESYNINSPVVWSIRHRQFDVLQALVEHKPDLLTSNENDFLSPLHAVLAYILGKQSSHFIDFLLAHGADGNAVVCDRTPYELAAMMFSQDTMEALMYAAVYLKKKLGSLFLLPDLAHFQDHKRRMCGGGNDGVESVSPSVLKPRERGVKVLSLRDTCCSLVRRSVREKRGDYHAQITSLPLPGPVIDYLLFKTVL